MRVALNLHVTALPTDFCRGPAFEGPRDHLLGFHWTKLPTGSDAGEVYVVGIDPDSQGQGLGRLQTLAGLHHLTRHGVREIELYVESDNDPAVSVYSRLGFTHHARDTRVMYRRG